MPQMSFRPFLGDAIVPIHWSQHSCRGNIETCTYGRIPTYTLQLSRSCAADIPGAAGTRLCRDATFN